MLTTNHTITPYPTLIKRLIVRGWNFSGGLDAKRAWTKRHNAHAYLVIIDYTNHRATFTRYQRITSSQQETN